MSEEISTELVVSSTGLRSEIQALGSGRSTVFSTLKAEKFEDKVALVNAMTNSVPVLENVNKPIQLVNFVIQAVDMVNETTGEIEAQPRIILIDADGKAYHAISTGLYKSIENILGIIGHPSTWPAPLPIVIERLKGGKGHFFTAKIAV